MAGITRNAHAKINLTLDVLRRREDGYHDLCMLMQSVSLHDAVRVETGTGAPLRVATNLRYLPNNERNLAAIAARVFSEETGRDLGGLALEIEKSIPVCAGMGGGSSDAAAVLLALNDLTGAGLTVSQLAELGARVGSDVPYCVYGGTTLVEGRGEVLTPLPPLPHCHIVLCKPDFRVSTPELFGMIDCKKIRNRPDTKGTLEALEAGDLGGVARRVYNVFEDVLGDRHGAEIAAIKAALIAHGALGAAMSGTGPTVFGIFAQPEPAQRAYEALSGQIRDTYLAESV